MSTEPLDFKSSKPLIDNLNPKLWYLYGKAYDFSEFIPRHPGGKQAILLGQGRDCTALLESYHTNLPTTALLEKYRINDNDDKVKSLKLDKTFTFNDDGFYHTLKKRTVKYFKDNNIKHTKGGITEILLWLLNVSIFLISGYYSLVTVRFGSSIAGIIFGIAKSLMVIRSTHAASHFAFSISPKLNRFVYWFNMALLGDTPQQWTAKHVIAHHIDTNVTPIDDDTMYPIKRILIPLERYWYHQYQHLYIWLLYFFVYLPWTVSHNIKFFWGVLFDQGKMYEGIVQCRFNGLFDYLEAASCIFIHHGIRLLPFLCLPTWTQAIVISLITEFSSSIWFSLQFAVNHETFEAVNNASAGYHNEVFTDANKNRDFGAHQVVTSHNYSIDYPLTLELSGGLNYQIEHHLYPSIHYKYYPDLSKIVQKTCKEYELPYNYSKSFFIGIFKHYQLLRTMGNQDIPKMKSV